MNIMTDYNDAECCICFDKKKSKNTCCNTCNNCICITCYKQIINIDYDEDTKRAKIKASCPVCRSDFYKKANNFTRPELVCLYTDLMEEYGSDWSYFLKRVEDLKDKYNLLAELALKNKIDLKAFKLPTGVS
jgi:hypothetical protein